MRTKQFTIVALIICLLSALTNNALAFYNPQTGHWLSRDPVEEPGFNLLATGEFPSQGAAPNPYIFVGNDSIDSYDLNGLTIGVDEGWDFINIGTDVVTMWCDAKSGRIGGAFVDLVGGAYDTAAAVVPYMPGGAGALIKTIRLSEAAKGLSKRMRAVALTLKGADKATQIKALRYTQTIADDAHHIIPAAGADSRWLKGTLRKQMDDLRARATKAGFDINGAENGVALPKKFHQGGIHDIDYYNEVLDTFKGAKSKDEFIKGTDILAEKLLKQSGKLK